MALAAALGGCSHQSPHQLPAVSCPDERGFVCFNATPASFKANPLTRETKLTMGENMGKRQSHRTQKNARGGTKAKPAVTAANAEPPSTRIPFPSPSLTTQLDKESTASASSGAPDPETADLRPTVPASPSPNCRTIQEQAATAVAEETTVVSLKAARHDAEPVAGAPPNNLELMVAVILVVPEIGSISELTDKNIAIDERYSTSSADVRIAIVAAGGALVKLSTGRRPAIDRLVNGEVPAAVLALVSADAGQVFPEIAGYRILRIPLSPRP
jgi:hypothetical protein